MDPISGSWWTDLGQRVWRQVLQVVGPVLALIVASGGTVDIKTAGTGLALAAGVTVVKAVLLALVGVQATAGSAWWRQALDRALPAAAGVVVAALPEVWADWVRLDWAALGWAAAAAAALAVLHLPADPPTSARWTQRRMGIAA